MSSIGEKIKDKLHIGRSSADDIGHNTMTHNTANTTTAPGSTNIGAYNGAAGSTVGSGARPASTTATTTGTGTTGTGMHAHTGTGMGNHTTTPGYKLRNKHVHNKAHTEGMTVPSTTRTTTETRTDAAAGTGVRGAGAGIGKACDTKYYTTVEDRPVENEVIERVVEHHPVEKKFVVETRPAGEHELTHQRRDEWLGTREEIKRVAPKSSPCAGGPDLVVQK